MSHPTPTVPRSVTLPIPGGIGEFAARLVPCPRPLVASPYEPLRGSWFITHPLGGPAGGTYTEVVIETGREPVAEHVLDAVVRAVADELYGRRWAFHYRPDQYADSIARHGTLRRERVLVDSVEVWT